ncbi:hypothetical protein H8356DRAFT_1427734 [Neocallimastix lanati (nom. inval.)]|nr:hypothetical protein H8356DRAFT_1427734 [Neocallimastix sp. JGI-2020a]
MSNRIRPEISFALNKVSRKSCTTNNFRLEQSDKSDRKSTSSGIILTGKRKCTEHLICKRINVIVTPSIMGMTFLLALFFSSLVNIRNNIKKWNENKDNPNS